MSTLTVQTLPAFTALNHALAAASTSDKFTNDGRTILLFLNGNASARTVTVTGNAFNKPGFGTISAADAGETFTIPGSGTNGGVCSIGMFPVDRFNDSSGFCNYTVDNATSLTVAAISVSNPL